MQETARVILDRPLNDVKEEAALLKVPVSWLYGETRKKGLGTIPVVRLGKYVRFEHEQVVEWLKAKAR